MLNLYITVVTRVLLTKHVEALLGTLPWTLNHLALDPQIKPESEVRQTKSYWPPVVLVSLFVCYIILQDRIRCKRPRKLDDLAPDRVRQHKSPKILIAACEEFTIDTEREDAPTADHSEAIKELIPGPKDDTGLPVILPDIDSDHEEAPTVYHWETAEGSTHSPQGDIGRPVTFLAVSNIDTARRDVFLLNTAETTKEHLHQNEEKVEGSVTIKTLESPSHGDISQNTATPKQDESSGPGRQENISETQEGQAGEVRTSNQRHSLAQDQTAHESDQVLMPQTHAHTSAPAQNDNDTVAIENMALTKVGQDFTRKELYVPGRVKGRYVSATPDYGSNFDIVSEELTTSFGIIVDTRSRQEFGLPNGLKRVFLGIAMIPWSFEDDDEIHERPFHVMRQCVHSIILGNEFLSITQTFTKYVNRVKEKIVHSPSAFQRLFFTDSANSTPISRQRLLGLINRIPVGGLADTCSDLPIINRKTANDLGLTILEGDEHITEVQFVDGSSDFTSGIVKDVDWCFSVSNSPEDLHRLDLHVMDNISCALILDKGLLWDMRAFITYGDCFIDIDPDRHLDSSKGVYAITRKTNYTPRAKKMKDSDNEARRRTDARDRIADLTGEERATAIAEEERLIKEWDDAHAQVPGAGSANSPPSSLPSLSNSASTSTAAGSSSGSTVNVVGSNQTPKKKKKKRRLGLGRFTKK
ncbi:hypothetical protein BCR34DRAFT_249813 [Clohesyomyces aquaticus]|uniref:Uncharacterized protein n=1 Tax=Clohesyomyces aquaticus TaxID=1231657 RepID=A0A1Y1ZUN4_9PLEO|nr:hypothetical protein BCR34DRAFT_249813 [Clohesyomyces aquaticus]